MAEIVNLRRARKKKARAGREIEAQSNRAQYGTPVSARKLEHARGKKAAGDLESLRLDEDAKK